MEIPKRVTLQSDGTYLWSGVADKEAERESNRIAFIICIIFSGIFAIFGTVMSARYSYQMGKWLFLALFAVSVLITFGVVHGLNSQPGERRRTYRMHDEGIRSGSGRRAAYFTFSKANKVIIGKTFIEMQARLGAFRAYVPKEDLPLVKDYIMSRVPRDVDISYEFEEE